MNIKLLSPRISLLFILILAGIAICAAACQSDKQEAAEAPLRPILPLPASDTLQSPSFQGLIYTYQGRRFLNGQKYEDALQCFAKAADLFRQKKLSASCANALRNMARVHLLSACPDSALYYYLQAQEEVADFSHPLFMDISTEISIVCRNVGDWKQAREQMLQYRRNSATDELPMRRLSGGMFLMKEDFISGRRRNLSALQHEEFKIKDYKQFADEYQQLYAEWCKMDDEQYEFDRDIKEKYNNEVLKNENQLIKNELLKRKVWLLSLGSGAMLLIIAGFAVFYWYRRDIRRRIGTLIVRLQENEKLLDEGRIMSEEERQRLLQENEGLSLRIEKLSARQKDKDELNSYLQKMNISYTKQLKEYQEIHSLLPVERTLALSRLCKLHHQPAYGLVNSDEEWLELFAVIDTLYGDMSARLKDYKLSLQERRICYLIRAGFTNSMIAAVSNVTSDAIAKSKQRMKAKFALPANGGFDEFIRSL